MHCKIDYTDYGDYSDATDDTDYGGMNCMPKNKRKRAIHTPSSFFWLIRDDCHDQ
jgi:hypothetical protein